LELDFTKLIRGYYEAEGLPANFSENSPVPDFAFNVLNTLGLLYTPILDKAHLFKTNKRPEWPQGKSFAACLTHDVDDVSAYSFKQALRALRSPFNGLSDSVRKTERFERLVKNTIKSAFWGFRKDPFHCYERWLNIEKKFKAKSTFFFWPGWSNVQKHHYTDCNYEMQDKILFDGQKCNVAEMMQEIHRQGWEIGLHPSWYAFNDVDELKRQRGALESAADCAIHSVRQHYLHYDIRSTPRAHTEAGFKYDSTLGFNDNIGFRFGTCYPWNLYDLKAAEQLPIVEIPLIIQDVAMLSPKKGLRLNLEMALNYMVLLADRVKDVGGVLTLLWHTNEIINLEYLRVYKKSLEYLKKQNCWMTTVREVGDWWTKRSKEK
jgi:peptidoglycan/xylan/chitin deacetylase (PgdA/CDA1 family)